MIWDAKAGPGICDHRLGHTAEALLSRPRVGTLAESTGAGAERSSTEFYEGMVGAGRPSDAGRIWRTSCLRTR